ncbi:uncharacterized protein L201_000696 [Kwoniella dendrophila CBS 6074]|uniref:Uncharacterized protein n=1 Tax=Kwoniella dendrophila CBS 6074 TaxID=1295534 RepID=A0AAX4JKA6_9TREE
MNYLEEGHIDKKGNFKPETRRNDFDIAKMSTRSGSSDVFRQSLDFWSKRSVQTGSSEPFDGETTLNPTAAEFFFAPQGATTTSGQSGTAGESEEDVDMSRTIKDIEKLLDCEY